MAKYNIGGYIFNDENSAKKAAKELKAVEYILGQIKTADEQGVLQVYKKLLNQRLFSTEIGMGFLNQLRQNLVASDAFDEADIPPVYSLEPLEPEAAEPKPEPVAKPVQEPPKAKEKISKKEPKVKKKKVKKSKESDDVSDIDGEIKRLRLINKLLILCVFTLLLIVAGMFIINSTINSPTILNYKETITDEYASWKEQLDAREKELNEREARLNEREAEISGIE